MNDGDEPFIWLNSATMEDVNIYDDNDFVFSTLPVDDLGVEQPVSLGGQGTSVFPVRNLTFEAASTYDYTTISGVTSSTSMLDLLNNINTDTSIHFLFDDISQVTTVMRNGESSMVFQNQMLNNGIYDVVSRYSNNTDVTHDSSGRRTYTQNQKHDFIQLMLNSQENMTAAEAARRCGIHERTAQRLWRKYRSGC